MNLTDFQLDFLRENFNIGVGKGAKVLNTMLSSHIKLTVPEIRLLSNKEDDVVSSYNASIATVDLSFTGTLNGACKLLFPSDSALKLVRSISDQPEQEGEADFDAMSEGVLKEIGNIVLNSVIGVLGNTLDVQLHYSVPVFKQYQLDDLNQSGLISDDNVGLLARIQFNIETMDVTGEILTIFKMTSFAQLLDLVDKSLS